MTRKLMATAIVCSTPLLAALWSAAPASASTTWRAQQVPVPANSGAQLLAVSCPATGVCFAVGDSTNLTTHAQSVLAERWAGGQWAIQPTPTPAGTQSGQFSAVSCLSATDCTAIGFFSTQTSGAGTLVEHWDGTSWAIAPSPGAPGPPDYAGLSCVSDTSCTAVGLTESTGTSPHELPIAVHWDGTSWTVQHVPLPAGITSGDLTGGVSCPSATHCVAVGVIATPGQASHTQPLAERWNGTGWSVQATPTPAGSYNPHFSSVSCTSAGRCTAVGSYLANGVTATALAERWNGTAWTIQNGLPANDGLASVSCTSSTSCTAVGITGAFTVSPIADHWDGTTWTQQPMPVPHNSARDVFVSAVSCRSATTCTAAGVYGRTAKPLADHE